MESISAKDRLADSLRKLVRVKPLKQVTVTEIVVGAGLSRQTFYQLFQDKYEVTLYIWAKEVERFKQAAMPNESLQALWLRFVTAMKDDRAFYKNLLENMDEQNSFFYTWLGVCMENPVVRSSVLEQSKELAFAMRVFAYGSNMCIRDWILDGCKESPELLVRRMILSIPGILMPYICLGES